MQGEKAPQRDPPLLTRSTVYDLEEARPVVEDLDATSDRDQRDKMTSSMQMSGLL